MISVRNYSLEAANGKNILDSVDLNIGEGQFKILSGPSGSGKTSLLKAILGLRDKNTVKSQGEILFDGINLDEINETEKRNILGHRLTYIPQDPINSFFPDKTIKNQIIYTLSQRLKKNKKIILEEMEEIFKVLKLYDFDRIMNSYPSQLSGGMLQRIIISNSLMLKPQTILLDEPTSALDEENKLIILNLLASLKGNTTILLVSHDIGVIRELETEIVLIDEGKIFFEGNLEQMLEIKGGKWLEEFKNEFSNDEKVKWEWKDIQ